MSKIQPCHLNFAARMEAEHAVYPRYVELLGEEGAARQAKELADRYLAAIAAYVEPLRPESEEVRHRARKPRRQPSLALVQNSRIFCQVTYILSEEGGLTRQELRSRIGCSLDAITKVTLSGEQEGFFVSWTEKGGYHARHYSLTEKGKEEASRQVKVAAQTDSGECKVLSLTLRSSESFPLVLAEIERRRGKATRSELADACGGDLATISAIAVLAEQEKFLICRRSLGRAKTYCLSDKGRAYLAHLKKEDELCQSHQ